jgi:hypothetical protein
MMLGLGLHNGNWQLASSNLTIQQYKGERSPIGAIGRTITI